jgi:hypothetical protein
MMLAAATAQAAETVSTTSTTSSSTSSVGNWFSSHFQGTSIQGNLFAANEMSLDLAIGHYGDDRHFTGGRRLNGQWGFASGFNYFISTQLGVSLDTNIGNNGDSFLDFMDASVIYRWPLENIRLAPYAFGGIGGEFDLDASISAHVGIGAEYRINALTGFFIDTRYVIPNTTADYWFFRFGVRLVF